MGVDKRITGRRGVTRLAGVGLAPFRVEGPDDRPRLVYRLPFTGIVDDLRPDDAGGWEGTTRLFGREVGRFRMWREA